MFDVLVFLCSKYCILILLTFVFMFHKFGRAEPGLIAVFIAVLVNSSCVYLCAYYVVFTLCFGDVHLAVFCGYPLAAAIPILTVSAWKNAMGSMNICVAFIDGAHGKKGHDSPA